MKLIFLSLVLFSWVLTPNGQSKTDAKILTADGLKYSLSVDRNGEYIFSYQNDITGETDIRKVIFRNKKDAKQFLITIGLAIHSKDGRTKKFSYFNYQIRILTEMGRAFMMINETGQSRATFQISDDVYREINIL